MEFLKKNRRFSFRYGEQSAWNCAFTQEVEENSDELITIYTFEDGLKVTNIARKIPGYDAYEWINWFENTGDSPTKIISMLWDCDCEIVCDYEEDRQPTPYVPHKKEAMQIFTTQGAYNSTFDFSSRLEDYSYDFKNFIFPGMNREYKCFGGRSSDGQAPFFNIHQHSKGVIMAIGWSGQWNCRISRRKDSIQLQSKIEDTHFRLYPGEKVRTSSVVIMFYEGELVNSQNKWRRLVKEHYSLIGKRREQGPFCAMLWGGMRSEELIRRVGLIGEYQIPLDYVWVDAGWYGIDTLPTNSEFEGDWHMHTGDWTISPLIHPQAMQDVSHKIKEIGKEFLLWVEPERVKKFLPIVTEHPEYFLESADERDDNVLLNLGCPAAYEYCLNTLSDLIEKLNIGCYRQDFNFSPLAYWRNADEEDRQGIAEMKHIMGLYRLWDELLHKYPNLIIDNCASGGRRIDVETLRRSIPLWRSDLQCSADFDPDATQVHTMNYATWMPYSGTGVGRICDTYRFRSTYGSALGAQFLFSVVDDFCDDVNKMRWFAKMGEEYIRVRPYFTGDFYPLTGALLDETAWCASQWDRPEQQDGLIQVFKRASSVYQEAVFKIYNICAKKKYLISDLDGGEYLISGEQLLEEGFKVRITEQKVAKIYLYKVIE